MSDIVKIIQNRTKENKTDVYKRQQEHINRQEEMGFVNPKTGASMGLKADGEVVSSVDLFSQDKKTKNMDLDISPEKTEITNRKSVITDDVLLNHQKLNMQLLALSDTSKLFDHQSIGGLTLSGTVMVKVWEKNLGRYVLMRRPIRTPLFSRVLNAPEIPEILDFDIANVTRLDRDLAQFIKLKRDEQNKITDDMIDAQGGSNYDQGNYNNYLDEFLGFSGSGGDAMNGNTGYTSNTSYNNASFSSPIRITEQLLTLGSPRRKGNKINIKGITVHSTGNPNSTAKGERAWLDNPDNNDPDRKEVAWHLVIDETNCIMAVPLDEYTVHAHKGNDTTFGIEICESGNREKTLDRAATLVAQLLVQYNFTIANLYRHGDWADKNCPRILNMDGKWTGWEEFKKAVQQKINNSLLTNSNPNGNMFCWPCPGAKIITAKLGDGRNHDGWDISEADALNKNIPICASREGTVEVANQYDKQDGSWGGYGGCVIINHGEGIKTLYGHMKNNSITVKKGDKVMQGQKLGIMGNTGNIIVSSGGTGCHLHFSIYQYDSKNNKTVIDPDGLLDSNS